MATNARKPYPLQPIDGIEHFHGNQLVFFSWDHHLMFAAPFITCVPPGMGFGEYIETVITPLLAPDPDTGAIDWQQAQWLKAGQAFKPDFSRSLADNGVTHKDLLRLHTPGLNTLCGSPISSHSGL